VEDVFSITGQTIVPSGGSGGTTTQIPSGGGLRLTIEEEWTDDGKMGTLELGIDDPGNVVTLVEFATQQGNGTKSAYATASGPPWQTSVLEVPKLPSYIFWRVTYTDADGSMQTTDGVHVFGAQATPDTPQISGAIDSIGNLNVAIRADALAAEVRVAASTSGVPSDATVDAATPIAGSSVSVASLLTGLAVGDVAYVAARGYGADGTPSNTGIATFTMGQGAITREDGSAAQPGDVVTIDASGDPVADPTLTPVDGFDFGFGNGSGALQANQHVGCRVPWNCTIDAWELYTEDGASASASVDIQKSSGVNPPSYGAVVGAGTKPNLSGAQWAQVTAITGWTTVALAAGDLLELTLTTVDGTVKTIRGFLSVTRT